MIHFLVLLSLLGPQLSDISSVAQVDFTRGGISSTDGFVVISDE